MTEPEEYMTRCYFCGNVIPVSETGRVPVPTGIMYFADCCRRCSFVILGMVIFPFVFFPLAFIGGWIVIKCAS